jgi:asparagine N-glycosylation enzyme membrane subunit Stt3
MCLQYLLIGAYSGFALNIVCIIRNVLFCHRDKRLLSGKWMPFAMAVVMAAVSALSWEGYHSIIIVAGLMINTVCMAFCDAQGLRKSILVTCPMVIVYNVIERSYSGIISESVSLCSAIIGIIRHVRETKAKQNNTGN